MQSVEVNGWDGLATATNEAGTNTTTKGTIENGGPARKMKAWWTSEQRLRAEPPMFD